MKTFAYQFYMSLTNIDKMKIFAYQHSIFPLTLISVLYFPGETSDLLKEEMSEKEFKTMRKKKKMEEKIGLMLKETAFQFIYMFLLLIVIYGNQDSTTYWQNSNIVHVFTSTPPNMVGIMQIHDCVKYFIALLHKEAMLNNVNMKMNEPVSEV